MRKKLGFLQKFLQLESSSGIILLIMAVIAMIWANSPLAYIHQRFIDTFLFIINEGLMAVFFSGGHSRIKAWFFGRAIIPAV